MERKSIVFTKNPWKWLLAIAVVVGIITAFVGWKNAIALCVLIAIPFGAFSGWLIENRD